MTMSRSLPGKEITYSISELAHEFDVTPRTIRYYEDGRGRPASTATRTRSGSS